MASSEGTRSAGSGVATRERQALVALLEELGPDAPTLCEGWQTRELAAHLVTREGKPSAMPGILIPALHRHTARLEQQTLKQMPYAELVRKVADGPPLGFVGLPGIREVANVHEFFIHHEDVRRAQPGWAPRALPKDVTDALRRRLHVLAPVLFRVPGLRLHLETPDRRRISVGRGPDELTMSGEVPELFLYAFGRRTAADVQISGSPAARERLAAANLRR